MNKQYLISKETLGKVIKTKVDKIDGYSNLFNNIENGIAYAYEHEEEDDNYYAEDCINVYELVSKCKEYLLKNKGINIITDCTQEPTVEKKTVWTAMAVKRGEVAYSYVYLNEAEILAEEQAPTEYEAVFKITDILLSNKEDE